MLTKEPDLSRRPAADAVRFSRGVGRLLEREGVIIFGSTATGIAISVASSQPVNIPVVIRDATGLQIASSTISLGANGHTSFVRAGQYPMTSGILGTVEFDAPAGAQISVLGIRSPPPLTFSTLPPQAK